MVVNFRKGSGYPSKFFASFWYYKINILYMYRDFQPRHVTSGCPAFGVL